MLSVKIKKKLGDFRSDGFLLDVEFNAPPGVTILFGASGSGKTTTLKSIAGIIRPDSGSIHINGHTLYDSARAIDLPIRKRGVGYVFQDLALFPHLSARENVEFGMKSLPVPERHKRAMTVMEALHIAHTADRRPRDISGGEAQRVALARALSCGPRMLLLDEPLSAIDQMTKLAIISDLKAINRELRLPIIYVTHGREEAVALGERVLVYERGRVAASGEPLEVFNSPSSTVVARLTGVENIFEGSIISKNEAWGTMTVEIADKSGQARIDIPFGAETEGSRVLIAVPSGDILLAGEELRSISARNILRGRILTIEDKENRTLVRVHSGVTWNASVTRQAAKELALSEGREVWLAIKTYSCYLLDEKR
jgi:molybdate transport system ATP-binding protein